MKSVTILRQARSQVSNFAKETQEGAALPVKEEKS